MGAAGRMKKEDKSKSKKIIAAVASGVVLLAFIPIANECFDLPYLIFRTMPTQVDWAEVIIELLLVFAIGIPIGFYLLRLLSRHRRAAEALRESEEKYRQLADNAGEAILVLQDGITQFVNPRAVELWGYSNDELLSKPVIEFIHKDDRRVANNRNLAALRGEKRLPDRYTYRITVKGGDTKWVETTYSQVTWEGRPALLVFMTDVTERLQTEEALKRSEGRYRTILEDMQEAYFEVDLAGNYTLFNDAICRQLGYSREDLMGMNYRTYTSPEEAKRVFQIYNQIYLTGKPNEMFRAEQIRKDGKRISVEYSAFALRNDSGEIIGFRGVGRDITERKAVEQQVLMTNKLASIGELASGVAHELNNPLTAVMGYAQLLVDNNDVPPHVKSDLDKVYQESQRAAKIVQNLLSFARRRRPEKTYFDVNDLVQRTLELRSYELKTTNISVYVNLGPDLPEIKADYHQIQQIIMNILINAEQALSEARRRGKITMTTSAADGRIRISIADNGHGILKDNISKIFDPFFTTKEVGKGTGLGLSVCHGIVTAHGGKIYVESERGRGSTFIVELPVAVTGEAYIEEDVVVAKESPRLRVKASGSILLVDDEPGIRDILTRILSDVGYRTEGASDAKTALTKIAEHGYDLCIIDLKMPKISGRKLYEILKEKHPVLAERVLFITGDTITPSTQEFLNSTGKLYLTKPFDSKVVIELVEEMLGRMAAADRI